MLNEFISEKEKNYYIILLVSSLMLYSFLFISIIGAAIMLLLIIVPLFFHLISLSQIRVNGVKVTKNQFQELYIMLEETAAVMGINSLPDLYIVQSEGALNAFASKFIRKNMIVLYSEFADLLTDGGQEELRFVIAHELSHIKRKHIVKQLLLLPGNWIPFLGTAYSRACEYTCDTMAAHFIDDLEASKRALTMLAVGKKLYKQVNINEYLLTASREDDFISWFGEKLATHPPLPKRIAYIQGKLGQSYNVNFSVSKKVKITAICILTAISILPFGSYYGFQALKNTTIYSDFMLGTTDTTPLMQAVSEGNIKEVEKKLNSNPNVNASDADGWTALHYAISWQENVEEEFIKESELNVKMTKLLLEYGSNPNSVDLYGDSVLSYAVSQGFMKSSELLIAYNAEVNITDEYGETALFDAVYLEDKELVKLLIDHGADINIQNSDGQTVKDIAEENNSNKILKILENSM